jgi:hypothetical protein
MRKPGFEFDVISQPAMPPPGPKPAARTAGGAAPTGSIDAASQTGATMVKMVEPGHNGQRGEPR